MEIKYKVDYPNKKITATGISDNGNIFTGQAKCAPEDTFDAKKGKKIARIRAQINQLKTIRKLADIKVIEALNMLDRKMSRVERLKNKIEKKETALLKEIKGENNE